MARGKKKEEAPEAQGAAESVEAEDAGSPADESKGGKEAPVPAEQAEPEAEVQDEPEAEAAESEAEPQDEPEAKAKEGSEAEAQDEPQAEPEAGAEGSGPRQDAEEAEDVASATQPAPGAAKGAEEDELGWKERRRLERSRRPAPRREPRSAAERAAEREERRRTAATNRSRYRRSRRAKKTQPGTGTPPAERRGNPTKVRQGIVVSDKADKTITVRIDIVRRHPAYEKIVRRSRTLHAHDEQNEAGAGDMVRVVETRPVSRTKRWRLLEVIEKAR